MGSRSDGSMSIEAIRSRCMADEVVNPRGCNGRGPAVSIGGFGANGPGGDGDCLFSRLLDEQRRDAPQGNDEGERQYEPKSEHQGEHD